MVSEYSLLVRYIPVFNKYILGRSALMPGTVFDYSLITSVLFFLHFLIFPKIMRAESSKYKI